MELTRTGLQDIAQELKNHYNQVSVYREDPPASALPDSVLGVLVSTVLSQASNDIRTKQIYLQLRAQYPAWEQLADEDEAEIRQVLKKGGLSRQKAGYIKEILRRLKDRFGEYSLDVLQDWDDEGCYSYLTDLPGVGPKTAACVMLFGLGRDVLPVDTHVARISRRLGLVSEGAAPQQIQKELADFVPCGWSLSLHLDMLHHGRSVCTAMNPMCEECILERWCDKQGV